MREGEGGVGRLGRTLWSSRGTTGQQDTRQWRAAMAGRELGMAAMRWPRGISTNRWQAPEWTWWEADLGRLGCELDFGPKTKFEAREPLFIFHLETKLIRAL